MKIGVSHGYTVVESMIFLAVSSALFVMVVLTLQGRQANAEFSAATREVESRIKDIINDVETGYYAGTENLTCTTVPPRGQLNFSETEDGRRGTSGDCIFIGKAIQFGVTGDNKAYNVFSIAGGRTVWPTRKTTELVDRYDESRPAVVDQATQHQQLPAGLVFGGMRTPKGMRSTVAFMASLNNYLNMRGSGSLSLHQVVALPAFDIPGTRASDENGAKALIKDMATSHTKMSQDAIWTSYVEVCMNGDAVKRHVIYQIGNAQRTGEVELIIGEGTCPSTFTS